MDKPNKYTLIDRYMGIKICVLSLAFAMLINPCLGFYFSGVNNSIFVNTSFANYGYVNGSQICTPANGLCNVSVSGDGVGYNTADGTWIYNHTSQGLTLNTTTANATYEKKLTSNCSAANYYVKGFYGNGTPVCDEPNDADTLYYASGLLLNLAAQTFSVKEGNMTNGGYCQYNDSFGLYCNSTPSFTDTNCTATNSCSEIVYDNNGTWAANQVGNYSAVASGLYTNITTALGYYSNASIGASLYSNASQYPSVASSLYTNITQCQGYYANSSLGASLYSNASLYPAVQSALYTNITQAQGYYSNASLGASYYTNASQGATAYSEKDKYYSNITLALGYYTNASQGATAYASMTQYYANSSAYPAVASSLYTNITTALGYYSNASIGASLYTNASNGNTAYGWGYYGTNTSLINSGNTTWPISTFTGGSAANVNITGKNLTVNCINFDSGGSICSLS